MENLLILIHEREEYENYIYDTLINDLDLNQNFLNENFLIDPTFWDPVIVCLTNEQINNLYTIHKECECFICTEQKSLFKKMSCCNNNICFECTKNWFNVSVFCPFCKKDQREM